MRKLNVQRIKLVVFDFDGVFTDNRVYVDENGKEMVCCWRSDGIGLDKLKEVGIKIFVVSSEVNPVVQKRCKKLGVDCVVGTKDKLRILKNLLRRQNLSSGEVCFVGNDLPDLECLKYVGFPVAIRGSDEKVLKVAKYITKKEGGAGAVREICDLIYGAVKREIKYEG
jgi:YrbI family 3-deoxy-D-manno-octulosonate 8-phosphate phosphatase